MSFSFKYSRKHFNSALQDILQYLNKQFVTNKEAVCSFSLSLHLHFFTLMGIIYLLFLFFDIYLQYYLCSASNSSDIISNTDTHSSNLHLCASGIRHSDKYLKCGCAADARCRGSDTSTEAIFQIQNATFFYF